MFLRKAGKIFCSLLCDLSTSPRRLRSTYFWINPHLHWKYGKTHLYSCMFCFKVNRSLKCTDWWQARADARRVCTSEQESTWHDFLFLFNLMRRLQLARPGLRSRSALPKSSHDILFSWALEGLLLHSLGSSQKLFSPFSQEGHFLTDPLLCWWQKEILLSQNIQMMVFF